MRFLLISGIIAGLFYPATAEAESKYFFNWFWPKGHFDDPDFRAYTEDPVLQQNQQYRNDHWQPEHWLNAGESPPEVIEHFFRAGILVKQGGQCGSLIESAQEYFFDNKQTCKGLPYLEVGEPFLHLSYQEQNRIAAFMDRAYNMTGQGGMYMLTYRNQCTKVGTYNKSGLRMH